MMKNFFSSLIIIVCCAIIGVFIISAKTLNSATNEELSGIIPVLATINDNDSMIFYFGNWTDKEGLSGYYNSDAHLSNIQYQACEFTFRGSTIKWIGGKDSNQGIVNVYIDGNFITTVDTYNERSLPQQVLYQNTSLSTGRIHKIRLEITKNRNKKSSDCFAEVDCFQSFEPVNYIKTIIQEATEELNQIKNNTKSYLAPDKWSPIAYTATAPESGVTLQNGVFNDVFYRNIKYLNECFNSGAPMYGSGHNWFDWLPASSDGRMLGGAGNSLKWGERTDLRNIVNTITDTIQARQKPDGYFMPYAESYMNPQKEAANDEKRNYDRVNLTKGLLSAGKSGNAKAYKVVREFYDWLNPSIYYPTLLSGNFGSVPSAHNCNNGHPGGLEIFFSPIGKNEDLVACEKYFVQDWWINQIKNGEALCLDFYPYHTPHSYLLLGMESWLDHYRATGAPKYISAANGFWDIINNEYEFTGGTMAISEEGSVYPPRSLLLSQRQVGETCGSVFWAKANHRLMQLYPDKEKYANEMEKVLYNVIMSCQDSAGYIRYFNWIHGSKANAKRENSCCEVNGVPFIANLPSYIYSRASDGLFINLYSASKITWNQNGTEVTLAQTTTFPYNPKVSITFTMASSLDMKIRFRIPQWATGKMVINVNDKPVITGSPGTFATINRTWSNNDVISFTLPIGFTTIKYTGLQQETDNSDRFALKYGPVVLALNDVKGRIYSRADDLPKLLKEVSGSPLNFDVSGSSYRFVPYWQAGGAFTIYPIVQP